MTEGLSREAIMQDQEREISAVKERVARKIWENILSDGIAGRVIIASEHSIKPEGDEQLAYDGIIFDKEIGEDLFVIPRLRAKQEAQGSHQPVSLKLDRIVKVTGGESQKMLAQQIWSGVTDEDTQQIARAMVVELKRKQQDVIDGTEQVSKKYGKAFVQRHVGQARRALKKLEAIESALSKGKAVIDIEEKTAALDISIPRK